MGEFFWNMISCMSAIDLRRFHTLMLLDKAYMEFIQVNQKGINFFRLVFFKDYYLINSCRTCIHGHHPTSVISGKSRKILKQSGMSGKPVKSHPEYPENLIKQVRNVKKIRKTHETKSGISRKLIQSCPEIQNIWKTLQIYS